MVEPAQEDVVGARRLRERTWLERTWLSNDMLGVVVFVSGAWGDPPTAWRILPAKPYYDNDGPWLVCELQVFASPDCTGDPIPAATSFQFSQSDTNKFQYVL